MGISNKQKIISANNLIIAENERKVYDAGYERGKTEGGDTTAAYEQGVADGKRAEYDAFWDAYQNGGSRKRYDYCFYRFGAAGFSPKYDIRPTGTMTSFMQYFGADGVMIDVAERLASNGVVLDTSSVTSLANAFYWTDGIKRLPTIDTRGANTTGTAFQNVFAYCNNLETIDELIFPDDGVHADLTATFDGCNNLKNIKISGTIGKTIAVASICLTRDSIVSIINALSTTTNGLSVTLSKSAKNNAFTDDEWATLIATRSNWTINLV